MNIAFHSYKGGVGRTKIMVGLAIRLAATGHRILLLDFDLDASGLATTFALPSGDYNDREMLTILAKGNPTLFPDAVQDVTHKVQEWMDQEDIGDGFLGYIPTLSDPEVSDGLSLGPRMLYTVEEGIRILRENHRLDFVIMDVKPGFSPAAGLAFPLAQKIVVVTRLDQQNLDGLSKTLPMMRDNGLEPLVVANFVPQTESLRKEVNQRLKTLKDKTGADTVAEVHLDEAILLDDNFSFIRNEASGMTQGIIQLEQNILK